MMPNRACKLFGRWLAFLAFCVVSFVACHKTLAANYSEDQTAYEGLANECLKPFNAKIDFVRNGYTSVESGLMQRAPISASCDLITSPESNSCEPVSAGVTMSWTAPATRKNGAALELSDIKGYELYSGKDGVEKTFYVAADINKLTITDIPAGEYVLAVAVEDKRGLFGPYSEIISFTVGD